MKRYYHGANKLNWRGRVDGPAARRFHEVTHCVDLEENPQIQGSDRTFGVVGFACDEGIRRNQGRQGAAEGPMALRESLSNIPVPWEDFRLYDLGNVVAPDQDLEGAQRKLGEIVAWQLERNIQPIVLGGGHSVSWGHYQGLPKIENLAIVNFDAHFDTRPLLDEGLGSSGTPFLQIATDRQAKGLPFHYYCLGIQAYGNTPSLFDTAKKLNIQSVMAEQFFLDGLGPAERMLDQIIEKHEKIYVSICMDVFCGAFAPGVSAPQPLGLLPWHVIPLLRRLRSCGKVISFDVAELSPPLDRDGMTAQLGASLAAVMIEG